MPKIVYTTDLPADPKRLYIYLYCDKLGCYKSTTKKRAAKSWLSLSESQRRKFLKTCRLKRDLDNTARVLSTEPFLKPLYNSTVEDSRRTVKDDENNDSCLDGDKEVSNDTCLDKNNIQQKETSSREQQQKKTYLDGDSEVRNDSCSNNNNVQQNETSSHEQQQKKTSLNDDNDELITVIVVADDDNELRNETYLNNNTEKQRHTCLHEQQQNKISIDDNNDNNNELMTVIVVADGDNEVRNDTCLDNKVQQNETCFIEQQQNKTTIDAENVDRNERNSLSVVAVDESHNNNDNDQQRDNERRLDVNSICREINGSDTESAPSTDGKVHGGFYNMIREPIPPTVKNPKDLFDIFNKDKNIKFEELHFSDRRTYSVLLSKIRKEYIEQYIEYLESLSDEQLYEHYLKQS